MRSPLWDAVFGLLTLIAWLTASASLEQGGVIERAIRTAMLGAGLGAGAVGLWLGWQVDQFIHFLEADGLLARLGVSKHEAIAYTVGFGRAVLGDYTAAAVSAAPDLMTIGLGLVAVGLTLRARAFVSQLKSAVPTPSISDTLRHS